MSVLLPLLFATCFARVGLRDVGSLLRRLSCLIDVEVKRSMLDSPDHCEASFADMQRDSTPSSQTDLSRRSRGGGFNKPSADPLPSSKDDGVFDADRPSADTTLAPRGGILGEEAAKVAMDGAETARSKKTGESEQAGRYTAAGVGDDAVKDIVKRTSGEQASTVGPRSTVDASTNKILKEQISSLDSEQETLEKVKALRESMDDKDRVLVPQKPASDRSLPTQYNWSPKLKKLVVPGVPRKLKVVKIVPVPVDDDGRTWT